MELWCQNERKLQPKIEELHDILGPLPRGGQMGAPGRQNGGKMVAKMHQNGIQRLQNGFQEGVQEIYAKKV